MIVAYNKKCVMILSSENVYYNMAHCQEHVSFNGPLTYEGQSKITEPYLITF